MIYDRKDVFAKCGVAFPTTLGALPDGLMAAATLIALPHLFDPDTGATIGRPA